MVLWQFAPKEEKNDDHDQDSRKKDLLHVPTWLSEECFQNGLANPWIWFGVMSFWPKRSSWPSWTNLIQCTFQQTHFCCLETGIGGVKSPIIRWGENFDLSGVSKFDPFLQSFYRKSSIWGSKVQAWQGQLSGRIPPLAFGTFWPPYPGLRVVALFA